MRAAQLVSPRKFELVDVPTPDVDAIPEGVLVKLTHACVCGSDLPFFNNTFPDLEFPLAPGVSIHECVGVVAESRSPRFEEGDEVLALPLKTDGLVQYLLTNATNTVHLPPHPNPPPRGGREGVGVEELLMGQPLGTVVWAARKLPNLINWNTVVLGQGPMGLLITHVLSNLGARTVVVADKLDARLAKSPQMRATHCANPMRDNLRELVLELTDGKGADLVVEAVGQNTGTINDCLDLVRRGGTILAFGIADENIYPFRYRDWFMKNVTLISTVGPDVQNDFNLSLRWIAEGRVDVRPLITHRRQFAEVQAAFDICLAKADGVVKCVLEYEQ